MSLDEDEGVATAEAPAEAEEPVPASEEQEQADTKESVDSGAQEPVDEGSEEQPELSRAEQVRQLIKDSVAEDPELAAALKQDYGVEADDSEVAGLRQQVASQNATTASTKLYGQYSEAMARLATAGEEEAQKIATAAAEAIEKDSETPFDVAKTATAIKGSNGLASGYGYSLAGGQLKDAAYAAVGRHRLAKNFTQEDIAKLMPAQGANGAATAAEVITSIITVAMDVASRSDPEGLRAAGKKEAEEESGAIERVTKLAELLGNGAGSKGPVSRSGGERKSSQPKDEQEAINWHATGKWTNKQMREWRQAQAVAAR